MIKVKNYLKEAVLAGYARKVQEILLAIKANKDNSKKGILALYLNKLNFGNNIRGIQKSIVSTILEKHQ